jgi:hypothetical protein
MPYSMFRREFLQCALASAAVIPTLIAVGARADSLPLLDPTDPVAQSLGFVLDASKVAANDNPTFKPGQHCGVCMQFQGKTSDTTAGCGIYAGHSVPARGWCRAFAQRA